MNYCWLYTFLFMLAWTATLVTGVVAVGSALYGILCAIEKISGGLDVWPVAARYGRYAGSVIASIVMLAFLAAMANRVHSNICAKGFATYWHESWK